MMYKAYRSEFSHRTRSYDLARLRAEYFDLLVIGGGILGAGIAREAALRGFKVALIEKNDLASGTTSQSSKLLRGGVPVLEDVPFSSLFRASREGRLLMRLASNNVWPLPFLYPIYSGSRYGPPLVNFGLWMYDALALFRNAERHRMLSAAAISSELPQLDTSRIVGGARYSDAGTDDFRLTLETARSAHRHGAVVINHARVEEFTRNVGKRIDGVVARDRISNQVVNAKARIVVNATGPWTDELLELDSARHRPRLRPTKGVHLLVHRLRFAVPTAVSFTAKSDGRLMSIIPRGKYSLIGASETNYQGAPDAVKADELDVEYILSATASEFPNSPLTRGDVISTYAGVRPRIDGQSVPGLGQVLEHRIFTTPSGLLTLAGGRLTTHRAMAEELVDRAAKILSRDFGIHGTSPSRSARVPLMETENGSDRLTRAQAEARKSLPIETREHLDRAYGIRQDKLLDYIVSDIKLRAPIVDGYPYIWAEVPHAVEQEMALTLADVMMRRLGLFYEVPDGAVEAGRDIAGYMSRLLDWLDPDVEDQAKEYAAEVARNREALKRR